MNLSEKTSSFKYTKIFKRLIHVRQLKNIRRNNWLLCNGLWNFKISTKPPGQSSSGFFRWQKDYGEHSKDIGKVIHDNWRKGSTLYASAEYIDGKLQYYEPKDPDIPNFGLARRHLVDGYPLRWTLYETVRGESVSICNEIKVTIECFEKKVFEEIDKDIQTSSGIRKLERRIEEDVLSINNGDKFYPEKFDFNSLYLYPRVLAEIFQEVNNRNNGKEKQELWTKEHGGYTDLSIGKPRYTGKTVGLGDPEMMKELERGIEKLLDDSTIRKFVRDYYDETSRLQTRENANQLDEDINHMWNEINSHNAFLRGEGSCQNSPNCRPMPKGSEGVYYAP